MAALTQERNTPQMADRPVIDWVYLPVAASTKIYQGALVAIQGGYATNASGTAINQIVFGRCEKTVDNSSGSAGALSVTVRQGVFKYLNSSAGDLIAQTNQGQDCYVADNQTVALTSNTAARPYAGKIYQVDSDGVWVDVKFPQGVKAAQSGVATLVAGTVTVSNAMLTASSQIVVVKKTAGGTGGAGGYLCPTGSRNVGAGTFVINAVDLTGALVATDTSTVDWFITG